MLWPGLSELSHSRPTNGQQWSVHFTQEGDTGGGISLTLSAPKRKKESFPWKWKTYFYVCLLEWKTRESSTNNKLWWFQNDSTDFSRFFLYPTPSIPSLRPSTAETAANEARKPKQTFFRIMEKSLPRENKLIKIVSPAFPEPGMRKKRFAKVIQHGHGDVDGNWGLIAGIYHGTWGFAINVMWTFATSLWLEMSRRERLECCSQTAPGLHAFNHRKITQSSRLESLKLFAAYSRSSFISKSCSAFPQIKF